MHALAELGQYGDVSVVPPHVDAKTLALRGLTSTDAQDGVSTFTFSNLRENVGLSDNQFDFKMPKGVEIKR